MRFPRPIRFRYLVPDRPLVLPRRIDLHADVNRPGRPFAAHLLDIHKTRIAQVVVARDVDEQRPVLHPSLFPVLPSHSPPPSCVPATFCRDLLEAVFLDESIASTSGRPYSARRVAVDRKLVCLTAIVDDDHSHGGAKNGNTDDEPPVAACRRTTAHGH